MPKTKSQTKIKLQGQNYKKWLGVLNIKNWNLFDSWDLEIGIFNVNPRRGFTLIEMLISLGIMGILAAATLSSITQSRDQVRLNQSAQEVAGLFREAQARALGVTAIEVGGVETFPGYGVYLQKILNAPEYFVIFPDLDNDKVYTPGSNELASNTYIAKYLLPGGIVISGVSTDSVTSSDALAVVYSRPDPDVTFQVGADFNSLNPDSSSRARVCLSSVRENKHKVISIWTTGQISVSETQDDCSI